MAVPAPTTPVIRLLASVLVATGILRRQTQGGQSRRGSCSRWGRTRPRLPREKLNSNWTEKKVQHQSRPAAEPHNPEEPVPGEHAKAQRRRLSVAEERALLCIGR